MFFVQLREFPDYAITDLGEVISLVDRHCTGRRKPHWRVLKPVTNKRGYPAVILRKDGKAYCKKVHRLMAETFLANPLNLPEVNHIDFDRSNYQLSNLEWVTSAGNREHRWKAGRFAWSEEAKKSAALAKMGALNPNAKLSDDQVREIRKLKGVMCRSEVATQFGINKESVNAIWSRKKRANVPD